MQYRRGQDIEVDVERLALEGPGVGRLDGLVVFVEKGLPGERVRARVRKIKRNFIQARSFEVLRPTPQRVPGRCGHLGTCGGCSWQELDYGAQLRAKSQLVQEALERLGGFRGIAVPETLASPSPYFYRNKMEYTFFAGREGQIVLGLHMPGAFDRVFDVEACFLMSESSNRVLARARALAAASGLPAYHSRRHQGFWRHLVLRESKSSGAMLVNFVTHAGEFPNREEIVRTLTAEFPEVVSIVRTINTRRATIAQGEQEEILHGPGEIEDRIGDLRFKISAASFFQPNPKQAERLFALAVEWAELQGHEEVLDLYAGTGTISLLLARRARGVTGIELGEGAVVDAQRNAALNGIDNCRFEAADVRSFLHQGSPEQRRWNVVIADPPRAGLHPDVVQALRQLHAPRLVYVSCNPSTLARDLQMLCRDGLYTLQRVQPVDMFPHTYHVETVAHLEAHAS